VSGRTVTLKVKYVDFRQITRARTLPPRCWTGQKSNAGSMHCSIRFFPFEKGVRLLGVALSSLEVIDPESRFEPQLSLGLEN
jgi:DNA polymerase-4